MLVDLDRAWGICRAIGVASDADLTVHHLLGQGQSFMDFIDEMAPLTPYLEHYFEGRFIPNSFGGVINMRNRTSYAQRVRRDIRSFSGEMPLLPNTLVMLDDFTADNGATLLLPGSHMHAAKPSDEEFYRSCQAGDRTGGWTKFNSCL